MERTQGSVLLAIAIASTLAMVPVQCAEVGQEAAAQESADPAQSQNSPPTELTPDATTTSTTPATPTTPPAAPPKPKSQLKYFMNGKQMSQDQYDAVLAFNESIPMMQAHQYAEAAVLLQKAVTLDPNLHNAHANLANALSHLGDLKSSVDHARQATLINADAPENWVLLATCCQVSGLLQEAVDATNEFLKRFPKDPMAPRTQALRAMLTSELDMQHRVENKISPQEREQDYFGYATDKMTTRWLPGRMPLKVYIAPPNNVTGYRPEFGTALKEAFTSWQAKSNGKITFKFVPVAAGADIDCVWTQDQSKVSNPSERGEAHLAASPVGLEHASIVILTIPIAGEPQLTVNHIHAACLHEIGHGLGLKGHSPNSNDVMFYSLPAHDKHVEITSRDANTLNRLYGSGVPLTMGQVGNKEYVGTNKVELNNAGVEFLRSGNFTAALAKFEAALKVDPDYLPAKQNLAAALNNLAMVSLAKGNMTDSESYLKRALALPRQPTANRVNLLRLYGAVLRRMGKPVEAQKVEDEAGRLASGK